MPPSKRPDDLIVQLQELGLTANESKAYVAVVKSGLCTAVQMALEAQLQRPHAYRKRTDPRSDRFGEDLLNARNRGIRMPSICNITPTNLAAVREMCRFAEVHHVDSSFGAGFAVLDESEAVLHYVKTNTPDIKSPTDISIHMRERDRIRRLKDLFELLWKNSIPAENKILELSGDQRESA